jgi:hypothetical protein
MKESDAKEKLCPIMYSAELGALPCQASGCACWTWDLIHVVAVDGSYGTATTGVRLPDNECEGHCGLAGGRNE